MTTAEVATQERSGAEPPADLNRVRRLFGRDEMARLGLLAAWAVTGAVHALLIAQSFTQSPVDVDEGYNLSVVRNITSGVGYISDGILTPYYWMPFEPGLSTGPTLILPAAGLHALGMDLFLSGRTVGVGYYVLMLVALGVLGRRISGRWGSIAAVFSPLLLDLFTNDYSPIYGPGDLLGEYGSVAFITLGMLAIRSRPGVAGALIGMAVLTKMAAFVAVPVLVLLLWLDRGRSAARERARAVSVFLAMFAAPLAAWELVKVTTQGVDGYVEIIRAQFASASRVRVDAFQLDEKTTTLMTAWFVPAPLVLVIASALLVLGAVVAVRLAQGRWVVARPWFFRRDVQLVLGGVSIAIAFVAMWFLNRNTDAAWIRHPSPGLLVGAGVVAATSVALVRALMRSGSFRLTIIGGAAALVFGASALASAATHEVMAADAQRLVSISHQREYAQGIADTGAPAVQVLWGPAVPLSVLAGVPARSMYLGIDPALPIVLDNYERAHLAATGRYIADELCGERIVSKQAIVCWPNRDAPERWQEMLAQSAWASPKTAA